MLEARRGGWVTRLLGPEPRSVSTGSVTGTGQPKGPCDSYSQGPFTNFWSFRGSLRSHLNHRVGRFARTSTTVSVVEVRRRPGA